MPKLAHSGSKVKCVNIGTSGRQRTRFPECYLRRVFETLPSPARFIFHVVISSHSPLFGGKRSINVIKSSHRGRRITRKPVHCQTYSASNGYPHPASSPSMFLHAREDFCRGGEKITLTQQKLHDHEQRSTEVLPPCPCGLICFQNSSRTLQVHTPCVGILPQCTMWGYYHFDAQTGFGPV